MESAVVRAEEVTLSPSEKEEIDPILFSELSREEKEIVRTAIENERYRKCPAADPKIPESLGTLSGRVLEHRTENMHVYLLYNDTYYALAVAIEDQVYSSLPD